MEEIRVQLYAHENDDYVELWKVIGKEKYYARYTWNNLGEWYYVCDPLGYCELDHAVPKDVMFVICDSDGMEYCRYSNADRNPLPKFETFIDLKWEEFKGKVQHNVENLTANMWSEWYAGETTMKINQWLISYKDPSLYPKEIEDMHGYDENWTGCWHEHEIAYEPIEGTEFEYLGNKYQFTKVKHKHDICGVEWYEFVCTDSPYVIADWSSEDRPWIVTHKYMGNWFDGTTHGTMYDKRSARELVLNALHKEFPKEKDYQKLLYIRLGDRTKQYWSDTCTEMYYADAADCLIGGDLHRTSVDNIVANIKERTKDILYISNRENKELITKKYPGIYGYDWCLI